MTAIETEYILTREGVEPLHWSELAHHLALIGFKPPDPEMTHEAERYIASRREAIAIALGKNTLFLMSQYPAGDERVRTVVDQVMWFRRYTDPSDQLSLEKKPSNGQA